MKTEIVIAVRGELEKNLRRTVEQASKAAPVCVVVDGNEPGNIVPENIADRVFRPWAAPLGPGFSRHEGIRTSDADLIVIADGHMTFPDGWLDKIRAHHTKHRNHLTCCRMQSLDQSGVPLPVRPEYGAWLCLKSAEVAGEYWALSAKWRADIHRKHGPVPAVMGACYAFRREWYERIGHPLSILSAWGQDEEILSVATHLMGGTVYLLPVTVGHIYAAAHCGRIQTADETDRIWGNRFAVMDAIPMDDVERDSLKAWMRKTKRIVSNFPAVSSTALTLREVLEGGRRTWSQLRSSGVVREPTPEEQKQFLKSDSMIPDASRALLTDKRSVPSFVRLPTGGEADVWASYDDKRRMRFGGTERRFVTYRFVNK